MNQPNNKIQIKLTEEQLLKVCNKTEENIQLDIDPNEFPMLKSCIGSNGKCNVRVVKFTPKSKL